MGKPSDSSVKSARGLGDTLSVWWGLLYIASLWLGIRLAYLVTLDDGKLTVIWAPTGVVVGALLVSKRRVWPALLAASTAVFVIDGLVWPDMGWSWGQLLAIAVITDLLRLLAAVVLLGWSPRSIRLENPADLVRLFVVVLGVFFLSAVVSVSLWSAWNPTLHYWHEIQLWWFSDALGCVVLVPWILAFFGPVPTDPVSRRPYYAIEAAGVLTLLALICLTLLRLTDAAQPILQRPYLVYPVLMWGGLRLALRFNATVLLVLSALLTVVLAGDLGPFAPGKEGSGSSHVAAVALQLFLLVTSFAVLALAVVRGRGRRTEAELREGHEQLNVLASTLRASLWLMDLPRRELVYVSPAFEALTGRPVASLLGRAGAWREIVHPDDRGITDASLKRMVETGHDDTEYRILRTDGTVRWVREQSAAVRDENGVVQQLAGSVEDMTHRHRAAEQRDILETELREANRRYQDFMRISGEAVWRAEFDEPIALDQSYDDFEEQACIRTWVAECNQPFARMYGAKSPAEIIGRRVTEFFPLRDRSNRVYRDFFEQDCRAITAEVCDERPTDGPRWYLVSFAGVVEDRKLVRIWGTRTDITASRRLQEKVREAQKSEALGQLAAGVAHDFNNLLAVISAHTELLEGRIAPDELINASLGAVREAIDHAAGVSRSLMTFSQELPTQREPVDLVAVIQQTHRMVARSMPDGVTIELDLPASGLPTVTGDAVQLQQVLVNLVLNARDAMEAPGGRILVAAEAYGDETEPQAGVRLAVQDNGRGMDEDTRRQVFDPFFTTRGDAGGTGLGLAVAYGIVGDHGGQIAVSSRPGRGTTVTIELPAAVVPLPNTPAATIGATGTSPDTSIFTILLAEDDDQVRAVMASALEARGYRVLPVRDAKSLRGVYDQVMGQGQPIDIIVTDVDMPGGSGLGVIRQLRAQGHSAPAVVVTGSVMVELDPQLDGNTVLINKPFGLGRLCDVVQNQLAGRDDGPDSASSGV